MSTTSTHRSFFTKEGKMEFRIGKNIDLSEENFTELVTRASRLPKDKIVIVSGIEIRDSLTDAEKQVILSLIENITQNDVDYCLENRLVNLSSHIVNDYLLKNPAILVQRGWADNENELIPQIINTLVNVTSVEKAHINFRKDGLNKTPITYAVVGNDNGTIRKLSILFQPRMTPQGQENKIIVAATVLQTN